MKLSELSANIQQKLESERTILHKKRRNTAYEILLYNNDGTRYFYARRISQAYSDNRGNYMPFGGGSIWSVKYGRVGFKACRNPFGKTEFELSEGQSYCKSLNGTIIPDKLSTKKEVIQLIKSIGIFDL